VIHRSFRVAALAICVLVTGLFGCRENTILGTDLLPAGDSINTISVPDTVTVVARSVYDDSVITSYTRIQGSTGKTVGSLYMSAGAVSNDPFFGKTFTSIYFQPAPAIAGFTGFGGATIDSAVLVLPYSGFTWGDTISAPGMKLRVYQMDDTLTRDTFYYSNQRVRINRNVKLGEQTVYFHDFRDSLLVGGAYRAPHLRIKLDTSTLMPSLRVASTADTGSSSAVNFVKAFKGIYVEADTNAVSSMLPYFNIAPGADIYTRAGIVIYYRNSSSPNGANVSYYFQPAYGNAFTAVKRNYTGTPAFNYLFGNPEANVLLLQNEPGAAIDVRLPYVSSLPKAIYNRAELVITRIDTAASNVFFSPARIFPVRVNVDGSSQSIADRLPESLSEPIEFVDGKARTVTMGGVTVTQYVINFPRELQQAVVTGRTDLHLRINGTTALPAAFRLIAGGRTHPQWKLKLNIAYSKQ
jgi:hypothetical protein